MSTRVDADGVDFSPDQLLTPAEVARIFRVNPTTVNRWASEGRLTFIRTPGGHRRYSREQITAILTGATGRPATPIKGRKRKAS